MKRPKILFVCTGNTCRSVMAEYLFKKMLAADGKDGDFEVISRGVAASNLYKVPQVVAQTLLNEEGISVEGHISTQIERSDFDTASRIFVMERQHKEILQGLFGGSSVNTDKVELLGGSEEIPDPIGAGDEVYRQTFKVIKKHLENIKKKLLPA